MVEVIEGVAVGVPAGPATATAIATAIATATATGAGEGATHVGPGEGAVFRLPDGEYRLLMTGEATGGAYAAWETTNSAGSGPPPHVHRETDEAFYVLEGTYEFVVAGAAPTRLGPGGFINLPRGRAHAFRCLGPGRGRVLALAFPAGFERFLVAVAPAPGSVPDLDRIEAVANSFGVELVELVDSPHS